MATHDMTGTSNEQLTLLHEAIDGFRAPHRFEVGEECFAAIRTFHEHGYVFYLVRVESVSEAFGYLYRVRMQPADLILTILQMDLLKYDAIFGQDVLNWVD